MHTAHQGANEIIAWSMRSSRPDLYPCAHSAQDYTGALQGPYLPQPSPKTPRLPLPNQQQQPPPDFTGMICGRSDSFLYEVIATDRGETGGTQETDGVMTLAARDQRFTLSHQLRHQAGQVATAGWGPHLGEHEGLTGLGCAFSCSHSVTSRVAAA